MFKTNFPEHVPIWGAQKIFEGAMSPIPPESGGLAAN